MSDLMTEGVTRNEKDANTVASSVKENREQASRGFAERFAPADGKPNVSAAVLLLLDTVIAALLAALASLVKADQRLALEVGNDGTVRSALDAAVEDAREVITGARESVRSVLGQEEEHAIGLKGDTPYDPTALARLGRMAVEGIGKLAPVTRRGFAFQPAALASEVAESVTKLEDAITKWVADGRANQSARAARNAAAEAFLPVFRSGTGFIKAVYEAADLQEAADRLKPGKRVGTLASTEPEAPAPAPVVVGGEAA